MEKTISNRIARELNITEEDFVQRKRFLQIEDDDIQRIKGFAASLKHAPVTLFDAFYEHLSSFSRDHEYFAK